MFTMLLTYRDLCKRSFIIEGIVIMILNSLHKLFDMLNESDILYYFFYVGKVHQHCIL